MPEIDVDQGCCYGGKWCLKRERVGTWSSTVAVAAGAADDLRSESEGNAVCPMVTGEMRSREAHKEWR